MEINIKKVIDLFNDDIVDDILMVDTYRYDNEINLKYIDGDIEFKISIKQKELNKLIDQAKEKK